MSSRKRQQPGGMWGLGAMLDLNTVTGTSQVIPFAIGEAPAVPESAIREARLMANVTNDADLKTFAMDGFVNSVKEIGSNPKSHSVGEHQVAFWLMLMTQLTGWRYWALVALHTRKGNRAFLHEVRANSFTDAETQIKAGFRAVLEQPIETITERYDEIAAKHWLH